MRHTLDLARSRSVPYATAVLTCVIAGAADFAEGLRNWRIWHLMGTSELRRRYARSRLGQFWVTLSTGLTVLALGLLWSLLWKMKISDMMPAFTVSYVLWLYLIGFMTDGVTVLIGFGAYYLNQRMTFSTALFALTYRNLIVLAHNLVIVAIVLYVFPVSLDLSATAALVGLVLTTIAGFSLAYLTAMLCTRFRDMAQVVANAAQILFFITPVLWNENQLTADQRWIADYNPFAIFLSIMRDPLLGTEVASSRWIAAGLIAIGLLLAAMVAVGARGRRIIYWI